MEWIIVNESGVEFVAHELQKEWTENKSGKTKNNEDFNAIR
jgi:hypothetical protein